MSTLRRTAPTPTDRVLGTVRTSLFALFSLLFALACDVSLPIGPTDGDEVGSDPDEPETRDDTARTAPELSVEAIDTASVTLSWTEVGVDGGGVASYEVRFEPQPVEDWSAAAVAAEGTCASPIEGRKAGATTTCSVGGLDPGTDYAFRLYAFREGEGGVRAYFENPSNVVGATTFDPRVESVSDLLVHSVGTTSVTLAWTQVGDGTGRPAAYQVRYTLSPMDDAWAAAEIVEEGTCAWPVEGDEVGAELSCSVPGLEPATRYDFRIVPLRVASDGTPTFTADPSNVATAETSTPPSSGSNEPADFEPLVETSYASPDEGAFSSSSNENFSIVSDPDAPFSPSSVARARFPEGYGDGRSPIWSEASISGEGVRSLYVSFWLKVSENWQGHPTGVNKSAILWTHEDPVVVANVRGTADGPLRSEIRIQDVPDGARNLGANRNDLAIRRGEWHRWEVVLVSNTGDSADGRIRWWIDGREAGAYDDVRFGTSGQSKIWNYVAWRPVWGGRGGTVEETMYMWMDHYYASGAR